MAGKKAISRFTGEQVTSEIPPKLKIEVAVSDEKLDEIALLYREQRIRVRSVMGKYLSMISWM